MSVEDLRTQVDQRLEQLEKAIARRDRGQIIAQAHGVCGVKNIIGGFSLTDFQRRRMRANAHEIDKLGDDLELKSTAEELRHVSNMGLS